MRIKKNNLLTGSSILYILTPHSYWYTCMPLSPNGFWENRNRDSFPNFVEIL